jgi:NitT/TauT family transport system substrate-binding protein
VKPPDNQRSFVVTKIARNKIDICGVARLLAAIGMISLIVSSSSPQAASAAPEKVKFGWPAAFSVTLAHVALGEELGFFKDEQIEPEIVLIQGAFAVLQQILSGGLDTGYVGLEAGLIAKQRNGGVSPIKFVYNYARDTIWEIVVPLDSPIKSLSDLKGKKIATGSMASGNVPVTRGILSTVGIDQGAFEFLVTGQGAPAFRALQTGNVDALNLYDTQHAALVATGFPVRRLEFPPEFLNMPSHGFPVTNAVLISKHDVLARFGRAWSKSIVACQAALDACVRAYWKRYPDLAPAPNVMADRLETEKIILAARLDKLTKFSPGEPKLMGSFTESGWQKVARNLKAGGLVESDQGPFSDLYSNELVSEYNRFDSMQVTAKAGRQ